MKGRTYIINSLIKTHGFQSYLEIGLGDQVNFFNINCSFKRSVDPEVRSCADYIMTSDAYFKNEKKKFDLIFIDGLHESTQVLRDIENALNVLNDGGIIVCHDMNPTSEIMQAVPRYVVDWTGDCWKAWVNMRKQQDLSMQVVDIDFGCGIIKRGTQQPIFVNEPTYSQLESNRQTWLNLITLNQFKECYGITDEWASD